MNSFMSLLRSLENLRVHYYYKYAAPTQLRPASSQLRRSGIFVATKPKIFQAP